MQRISTQDWHIYNNSQNKECLANVQRMCIGDSVFISCLFISHFVIVSVFRLNAHGVNSQSSFCQWSIKIHNEKRENSIQQLLEVAHPVSSYECAVEYKQTNEA